MLWFRISSVTLAGEPEGNSVRVRVSVSFLPPIFLTSHKHGGHSNGPWQWTALVTSRGVGGQPLLGVSFLLWELRL